MDKAYVKRFQLFIFDLDGTVIETIEGVPGKRQFRKHANDWRFIPGRLERVLELKAEGKYIATATNQGGVPFGLYGPSEGTATQLSGEQAMDFEIKRASKAMGADHIGVCYTHPKARDGFEKYRVKNDPRRKPGPDMLNEAMDVCMVEHEYTVMIGDREEDEIAAARAGCHFIHADVFFMDADNAILANKDVSSR